VVWHFDQSHKSGVVSLDLNSRSGVVSLWPKGGKCPLIADTASEDPVLEISLCKSHFVFLIGVHAEVI